MIPTSIYIKADALFVKNGYKPSALSKNDHAHIMHNQLPSTKDCIGGKRCIAIEISAKPVIVLLMIQNAGPPKLNKIAYMLGWSTILLTARPALINRLNPLRRQSMAISPCSKISLIRAAPVVSVNLRCLSIDYFLPSSCSVTASDGFGFTPLNGVAFDLRAFSWERLFSLFVKLDKGTGFIVWLTHRNQQRGAVRLTTSCNSDYLLNGFVERNRFDTTVVVHHLDDCINFHVYMSLLFR